MKLAEVIEQLEKFGFVEEHIRQGLAQGDSVFNAWEAMKNALMIRWDGMNQMESAEKLAELKPIYDRLMGLKFKGGSATKRSDLISEEQRKKEEWVKRTLDDVDNMGRQSKERVVGMAYDKLKKRGVNL
jgi:hypothetical protein